jgi:hypothetical protein
MPSSHRGEVEVYLNPYLTPTLEGDGWSAPRPGRFNPGKETRDPLYERLDYFSTHPKSEVNFISIVCMCVRLRVWLSGTNVSYVLLSYHLRCAANFSLNFQTCLAYCVPTWTAKITRILIWKAVQNGTWISRKLMSVRKNVGSCKYLHTVTINSTRFYKWKLLRTLTEK